MITADTLVFFATHWGYTHGGVNAFNIDLCKAIAAHILSEYEIVCVVPTVSRDEIHDEKLRSGIRLIGLEAEAQDGKHLTEPALAKLISELKSNRVVWCIGHDVVTGFWAQDARGRLRGARVAIVHHMDYDAYKYLQPWQLETAERVNEQKKLLHSADLIFTVGPKLFDSARDKIRGHADIDIIEIIPGLPRVRALDPPERFQAITMGRLERQNAVIKQSSLAADAFGSAVGSDPELFGASPSLTLLGVSDDNLALQQHELSLTVQEMAGRAILVRALRYEQDREQLLDDLSRHSVLMMLSLHEGFGLAGWEAIGAAVPLIVSKNSGLYETIDKYLGGEGIGCLESIDVRGAVTEPYYHERDLGAVREALCRVARRQPRAKADALRLRALIEQVCTWHGAAALACAALKVRTLTISQWTSDRLADSIKSPNAVVSAATRSEIQFQSLWDGLQTGRFREFVLLFGGIATSLIDNDAFARYESWLLSNPEAELLLCYESGQSALARARELDPNAIEAYATTELPRETGARMLQKAKNVKAFCEQLSRSLRARDDGSAERFGFVALRRPLPSYVMIADGELFFTPLTSRRSSESLSFRLAKRPTTFAVEVLRYVIYNLQKARQSDILRRATDRLTTVLVKDYGA